MLKQTVINRIRDLRLRLFEYICEDLMLPIDSAMILLEASSHRLAPILTDLTDLQQDIDSSNGMNCKHCR